MNAGNGENYLYNAINRKRDLVTVCYYSMVHAGMVSFSPGRVSVKFSSVIHLTVDNYYLRGFGLISISV